MDTYDYSVAGARIKALRKQKHLKQTELAELIGKSLRTVQKYETGEIEVSIAVVNKLAEVLDSSLTYIMGYDTDVVPIRSLADVFNYLLHLEQVEGMNFGIEVNRPPHSRTWECSLTFKGKEKQTPLNADMCLFLEDWKEQREELHSYAMTQAAYRKWKDKTLAYYAATPVEVKEPEDLSKEERIRLRNLYLENLQEEESPNE